MSFLLHQHMFTSLYTTSVADTGCPKQDQRVQSGPMVVTFIQGDVSFYNWLYNIQDMVVTFIQGVV